MASRTPSRGEKSPRVSSNTPRDAGLPRHRREIMNGPDTESGPGRLSRIVKVKTSGESGRSGFHPLHFFKIIFRSTSWISRAVNILWPVVPAAIVVRWSLDGWHTLKFILAYIAMVPCANLIGFAGQELARKLPHVVGVLVETTYVGSLWN
jgi:Ca2+:H+ antiporter